MYGVYSTFSNDFFKVENIIQDFNIDYIGTPLFFKFQQRIGKRSLKLNLD